MPIDLGLARKREVLLLAGLTRRTRHEVTGLLVDFWAWVSGESADGLLPGVTTDDLALVVGADADFWDAVSRVGWLEVRPDGLAVPRADRWLTRGAKARLQKTIRQALYRHGHYRNVDVPVDGGASTGATTTEQKRREEYNPPLPPPPQGGAGTETNGTKKRKGRPPREGFAARVDRRAAEEGIG